MKYVEDLVSDAWDFWDAVKDANLEVLYFEEYEESKWEMSESEFELKDWENENENGKNEMMRQSVYQVMSWERERRRNEESHRDEMKKKWWVNKEKINFHWEKLLWIFCLVVKMRAKCS